MQDSPKNLTPIFHFSQTNFCRLTITAGCAMDLTDYPLDEQFCDLGVINLLSIDFNFLGLFSLLFFTILVHFYP